MSGDQRGGLRRQKDDCPGYLRWFPDAMEGSDVFHCLGVKLGRRERRLRPRRVNEGRRDRIDVDVVRTPLNGQALSQMCDTGLGHAIDRLSRQRDKARLRTHIDDPSAALFLHHLACGLTGEEGALEIYIQRTVEVFLAHVQCEVRRCYAGVIHQDVELAQLRGNRGNRLTDLLEVVHLHLQRHCLAPERLDLGYYAAILFYVAQTKRDIRAGLGKRESNSAAEAASGSSYQRGLTVKTK